MKMHQKLFESWVMWVFLIESITVLSIYQNGQKQMEQAKLLHVHILYHMASFDTRPKDISLQFLRDTIL